MALVTLNEAKQDLRIVESDQDGDVELKMEAATEIVLDYITAADPAWTAATCPFLIKAAVILVLRNLYDVETSDPLNGSVKNILHRFRDPSLA